MRIRDLWFSPALRVTLAFGVSGAAFAAGNLLLARVLPASEYALLALMVALIQISIPLGPAGVDGVVIRRKVDAGPGLLRRVLFTSGVAGVATVIIGRFAYELGPPLLLSVLLCTLAGGAGLVAGATYQGRQRFRTSLVLSQGQSYLLALAGIATLALGIQRASIPCAILAGGLAVSAALGWADLFRTRRRGEAATNSFTWSEGFAIVGVRIAIIVLIQLERLVIPGVLTLRDLATFAVLASIAGSPYRMLQMGVGYTMLPRLRGAKTVVERRHLLAREGAAAFSVAAAASVAIWFLTPVVVRIFLSGKYVLPGPLILAAIVAGNLKVLSAFASSVNLALGSTRQLAYLNISAWVSVAAAVGAAIVGARWGLVGVVYGVGAGWLTHAFAAGVLAVPLLGAKAQPERGAPGASLPAEEL